MKKKLSELGFRFDGEVLSDFEVDVFSQIASEVAQLKMNEEKRAAKRGRRG